MTVADASPTGGSTGRGSSGERGRKPSTKPKGSGAEAPPPRSVRPPTSRSCRRRGTTATARPAPGPPGPQPSGAPPEPTLTGHTSADDRDRRGSSMTSDDVSVEEQADHHQRVHGGAARGLRPRWRADVGEDRRRDDRDPGRRRRPRAADRPQGPDPGGHPGAEPHRRPAPGHAAPITVGCVSTSAATASVVARRSSGSPGRWPRTSGESGSQKALEPMNAADRKVVHDTVNEIDGVSTVSEGEDQRRRVVIVPRADRGLARRVSGMPTRDPTAPLARGAAPTPGAGVHRRHRPRTPHRPRPRLRPAFGPSPPSSASIWVQAGVCPVWCWPSTGRRRDVVAGRRQRAAITAFLGEAVGRAGVAGSGRRWCGVGPRRWPAGPTCGAAWTWSWPAASARRR